MEQNHLFLFSECSACDMHQADSLYSQSRARFELRDEKLHIPLLIPIEIHTVFPAGRSFSVAQSHFICSSSGNVHSIQITKPCVWHAAILMLVYWSVAARADKHASAFWQLMVLMSFRKTILCSAWEQLNEWFFSPLSLGSCVHRYPAWPRSLLRKQ